MTQNGCPEIFNTDQGAQFTSKDFTGRLQRAGVAISMDGKGRALDKGALLDWLKPRVARHQIPGVVEFRDELPYTPVGKPDKKVLRG